MHELRVLYAAFSRLGTTDIEVAALCAFYSPLRAHVCLRVEEMTRLKKISDNNVFFYKFWLFSMQRLSIRWRNGHQLVTAMLFKVVSHFFVLIVAIVANVAAFWL